MQQFTNATKAFNHYYGVISSYGYSLNDTKVIFNEAFTIIKPEDSIITTDFRKFSKSYAETEWEWYLSGNRSVAEIKKKAPLWDKMHNGDNLVWSNYGYWWKRNDQLKKVIQMLKDDRNTRKAVVVHYSPDDLDSFTYDTPCNVVLNFYVHNDHLHLTVMARSIDLWYGFCNDQYIFSKLLSRIAREELNLKIGQLNFFITNFHLYSKNLKA